MRLGPVTNGNIYAPVMMIAEKAADLILGDAPLPPEHVPVYRATRPGGLDRVIDDGPAGTGRSRA